ncbi:MAG TPA: hypothetical protein DCQ93_04740 [Bacteroidetes bacterium]|nr:hypothetical protein [Bacteroidota bacterium]
MKTLNPNWITEGLIDFEYKKYLLLDYLQSVHQQFDERKLYPTLSDIISHYQNLKQLKEKKEIVAQSFPKHISKIDFENFRIEFEQLLMEDKTIEELEAILDFSIPEIQHHLEDGRDLYASVENDISIFPVGIVPINPEFGFMFLSRNGNRQTRVYEYQVTLFENSTEKFRGIRTEYVCTFSRSIVYTYENMKHDLLRKKNNLITPGTFVVESKDKFPLQETFLPVAKRSLVRYLFKMPS